MMIRLLFIALLAVSAPLSAQIEINAGLAGAWFDPATAGQGLLIDDRNELFIAWFTYTQSTSGSAPVTGKAVVGASPAVQRPCCNTGLTMADRKVRFH